jgi:hypothetical protein
MLRVLIFEVYYSKDAASWEDGEQYIKGSRDRLLLWTDQLSIELSLLYCTLTNPSRCLGVEWRRNYNVNQLHSSNIVQSYFDRFLVLI